MSTRGDVVLVDFPFADGGSKVRPALVVQNDRDNARIAKTVIAMITGNLRRTGDASHYLIDPATRDGAASGLHGPSLLSCNNLYTIDQAAILRTLGSLAAAPMRQVDQCLKNALALP